MKLREINTPSDLQIGDIVFLKGNNARIVKKNNFCEKTGLGIYSKCSIDGKYYCTTYLGNYDQDFRNPSSYGCFDIRKIITKENPKYKKVLKKFNNNEDFDKDFINDIIFDWKATNQVKNKPQNYEFELEKQ